MEDNIIHIQKFEGLVPQVSPQNLDADMAEIVVDVDLETTVLTPYLRPASLVPQEFVPIDTQTIFLTDEGEWLNWNTDVDVVGSPIINDARSRIYFTGDGAPKVRSGAGDDAGEERDLGIIAPPTAPLLSAVEATVTFDREWHFYYEKSDGTRVDEGDLVEGDLAGEVNELVAGKEYFLDPIPDRVDALEEDRFVMFFIATDTGTNASLGQLYPEGFFASDDSDFEYRGAPGSAQLIVTGVILDQQAEFNITYDTSRTSQFKGDRAYVYTYVSDWGEEGPPSPISLIITIDPTQDVLINFTDVPPGDTELRRLYRSIQGTSGTFFQFIDDIEVGTNSYLDSKADIEAGELLPSQDWTAPPEDLAGLVSLPGGFFAGFLGNEIYFSVPYQPHAWPFGFVVAVDFDIVGLGVSGNTLVVCTTGFPYAALGYAPDQISLSRIHLNQSCASKRSITSIGTLVCYASPDGLVGIQDGFSQLLSSRYFRRKDWALFGPETMNGAYYSKHLYLFSEDIASIVWAFDDQRSAVRALSVRTDAVFTHLETETMYLVEDDEIKAFDQAEENHDILWKSKTYRHDVPVSYTAARIIADGYPITFMVFTDEVEQLEVEVLDNQAFKLPVIQRSKRWQFQFSGPFEVKEFTAATSLGAI